MVSVRLVLAGPGYVAHHKPSLGMLQCTVHLTLRTRPPRIGEAEWNNFTEMGSTRELRKLTRSGECLDLVTSRMSAYSSESLMHGLLDVLIPGA